MLMEQACSVDGCSRQSKSRGWCATHYARWRKHGDPTKSLLGEMGQGYVNNLGYRMLRVNGKQKGEHLVKATKALGKPIPKGAHVHHVDYNPLNNENSNLVICPDAAYHSLLHLRTNAIEACGNPDWRKCAYCKQHDDPANMYKNPRSVTYSHRACFNARQTEIRAARRAAKKSQ